ncbi:MAG: aspartate/glutamate racemase family protein [Saccharofermentanales bacterium]
MNKILGIIGGMGPEATAGLFMKIIKATPAEKDQDHFRIIIDSNPKIPDRTAAILYNGESPIPQLIETAKNLEKLGVHVAGIPCITAHNFIDDIRPAVSYKILNALEELNKYITGELPQCDKIGVLCSSGTMKTGLFNRFLSDYEIIYPCEDTQNNKVMEAIFGKQGIKQGNTGKEPKGLLYEAGIELIKMGAKAIIGGCTEIPLVLFDGDFEVPFLDPMAVLAKALVDYTL